MHPSTTRTPFLGSTLGPGVQTTWRGWGTTAVTVFCCWDTRPIVRRMRGPPCALHHNAMSIGITYLGLGLPLFSDESDPRVGTVPQWSGPSRRWASMSASIWVITSEAANGTHRLFRSWALWCRHRSLPIWVQLSFGGWENILRWHAVVAITCLRSVGQVFFPEFGSRERAVIGVDHSRVVHLCRGTQHRAQERALIWPRPRPS